MKLEKQYLSFLGLLVVSSLVFGSPLPAVVALVLAVYYTLTSLRFNATDVKIVRSTSKEAIEGRTLTVTLHIRKKGNARLILRLKEWNKEYLFPLLQEKERIVLNLIPKDRGIVLFTKVGRILDFSGLFEKEVRIEGSDSVVVYPSPESLAIAFKLGRKNPLERATGFGGGMELLEFYELREFVPGDSIKKIEWKATSRLQKLIVRVLMREVPSKAYVLINVDDIFLSEFPFKGRVNHLILLLTQIVSYLNRTLGDVAVIAYNERGIIGQLSPKTAVSLLRKLELRGKKRLYPLRSRAFSNRIVGRGLIVASRLVPPNSYVIIIDDIGLYPSDIIRATFILRKKNCKEAVVYPNPELFLEKKGITSREEILHKLSKRINLIEVGPQDTIKKVVEKL